MKRCPRCGELIDRNDSICPKCGKRLKVKEKAKTGLFIRHFDK